MHTDESATNRLTFLNCAAELVKRCAACGQHQPLGSYYRNARCADGYQAYCKACTRQRAGAWRRANRDRYYETLSLTASPKVCQKCRLIRAAGDFYPQVGSRDARFSICKTCLREQVLARQAHDPEPHRRAVDRWRRTHSEQVRQANRAQLAVYRAVRAGELIRPGACERCATACKPDAAHANWQRPLDVAWLCRRCRAQWDIEHPKGANVKGCGHEPR